MSVAMWVQSMASLNELKIQRGHKLWCRLQMRFRSCIAVTVASARAAAPFQPLAWEPPCATGAAVKKKKKKKGFISYFFIEPPFSRMGTDAKEKGVSAKTGKNRCHILVTVDVQCL